MESKKEKAPKEYKMKHFPFRMAAIVFIWVAVAFFVVLGIKSVIKTDPTDYVNRTISDFRNELSAYKDINAEVCSYAELFAKEYLTYNERGEDDYRQRLSLYAAPTVYSYPFTLSGGSAQVNFVNAYKQQSYSQNQYDVWVRLQVNYVKRITDAGGSVSEQKTIQSLTLKIPVSVSKNGYIIEDLPVYVADDSTDHTFESAAYKGTQTDEATTGAIGEALTNFFKVYYGGEQSEIDYYLASEADRKYFAGLHQRVTYDSMPALTSYKTNKGYLATVTVLVVDANGVKMPQSYNISLIYKDGRYYLTSIDTRSKNINEK